MRARADLVGVVWFLDLFSFVAAVQAPTLSGQGGLQNVQRSNNDSVKDVHWRPQRIGMQRFELTPTGQGRLLLESQRGVERGAAVASIVSVASFEEAPEPSIGNPLFERVTRLSLLVNVIFTIVACHCYMSFALKNSEAQADKYTQRLVLQALAEMAEGGRSGSIDATVGETGAAAADAVYKSPTAPSEAEQTGPASENAASIPRFSGNPIDEAKKQREASLGVLENIAFKKLSYKERHIAIVPMGGSHVDGQIGEREDLWLQGYLGWWESEDDYKLFRISGRPAPKGSLSLQGLQDAHALHESDKIGYVLLQHTGCAEEAVDSHDMYIVFEGKEKAETWVKDLRDFRQRLLALVATGDEESAQPESPTVL
eukprot:TRINITY_DN11658_c0_g1_i3.p1 TRINITY_DN11658_c0_g1~~TRINITY_DN11658_c0_g1_i3.p1  ORF type:complete len:371 (+),score=66.15 TRINITY_DN11658_c0_g1_i3:183-1295(+)